MQLNQKILNPHGNLFWFTCEVSWSSVSLWAYRSSTHESGEETTPGWESESFSWRWLWRDIEREEKRCRKKMSQKKEIYVAWRAYNLPSVFFFVLMSSRWAPTLAMRWQLRTSIMTGESLLLQQQGERIVKMLARRRPSDQNGK